MKHMFAAIGLLLSAIAPGALPVAAGEPILSLDLCADQYLLALGEPGDVLALTQFSRMPHSYHRARAANLPIHHDRLEQLVSLNAKVALRTTLGDPTLDRALERFGTKVLTVGAATNLDEAIARIEEVGSLIGREEKAAQLADAVRDDLARIRAARTGLGKPDALYLVPGGTTTGAGTFVAEILEEAGLTNAATARGQTGWGSISLEDIILNPPDVLVTTFLEGRTELVRGWLPLDHPLIAKIGREGRIINLPSDLVACPAWMAVEAVAHIQRETKRIIDARMAKRRE